MSDKDKNITLKDVKNLLVTPLTIFDSIVSYLALKYDSMSVLMLIINKINYTI